MCAVQVTRKSDTLGTLRAEALRHAYDAVLHQTIQESDVEEVMSVLVYPS